MQDGSSVIEIVIIYPNGDALIATGDELLSKRFMVSSTTLKLACEPWKAMLRYCGRLGSQSNPVLMLNFEGDDGDALELLLHIAHLNFERVPAKLEFEQLLSLTVLTNKYQATRLIRPWINQWITQLRELVKTPGHEEYMWIAWEFGFLEEFDSLVTDVTMNATTSSENECIINGSEATLVHIPPGLPESILDVRAVTIDRLLAVPYSYIDRIIEPQGNGFCRRDQRTSCDVMSLGSLVKELARLDLWPTRKTSSDIDMSISQLAKKLNRISLHVYPHYRYLNPIWCDLMESISIDIEKILNEVPSSVTREHRAYMKRQKTLLNLSEGPELVQ